MPTALPPLDQLPFVRTISPDDWMARGTTPDGYFRRGYGALRLIVAALDARGQEPSRILDFGCGHGGVARMLRARFPQATITGQDVSPDWLAWCEAHLGIATRVSPERIRDVALPPQAYDLIWVGSVFTHIPPASFDHLVGALAPGGIVVFTTAGAQVRARFDPDRERFLDPAAARAALQDHDAAGYGFVPYQRGRYAEWGRALTTASHVRDRVQVAGADVLSVQEADWGGRQDVFVVAAGHAGEPRSKGKPR